jgi:hypothetical protein
MEERLSHPQLPPIHPSVSLHSINTVLIPMCPFCRNAESPFLAINPPDEYRFSLRQVGAELYADDEEVRLSLEGFGGR